MRYLIAPDRVAPDVRIPTEAPTEAWNIGIESDETLDSAVITDGQLVYLTSLDDGDSIVRGVSLEDGEELWDRNVDGDSGFLVPASTGIVLVSTSIFDLDAAENTSSVVALDVGDEGDELWDEEFDGFGVQVVGAHVVLGGFGADCCIVVEVETGDSWDENADTFVTADSDSLYFSDNGDIVGYDIESGDERSEIDDALDGCDEDCASEVVVRDGIAYVLADGDLRAFDLDGEERFGPESVDGYRLVLAGDVVVVVDDSGVEAFDAVSGDELDDWDGDEDDWADAWLLVADKVVSLSEDQVVTLDPATGDRIDRLSVDEGYRVEGRHIIGPDGVASDLETLEELWDADFDRDAEVIAAGDGAVAVMVDDEILMYR